ncbi:YchJ family protein [Microbulbifer sp. Q7]|uniref:YchJ family protein n=1 Tax=Microbulbifer sp. Q7 TaxID=1785091 RepID=UPI000830B86C|nr:YchJ family metal-binding protein [Microbulbifer sp. Q7]
MSTPATSASPPCHCCSGKPLAQCCGIYLSGQVYPNTAEALMRSRYSAFVTGNLPYLTKTWHPDTCPELNSDDLTTRWQGLEVVKSKQGLKKSIVEFRAWFTDGDTERALHEISLFKLHKKRWVYVEPLDKWP